MEPVRGKALLQLIAVMGGLAAAIWVVIKLTKPFEEGVKLIGCKPCGTIPPE